MDKWRRRGWVWKKVVTPSPSSLPPPQPKLIGGILVKMVNWDLEIDNYKVNGETVRVIKSKQLKTTQKTKQKHAKH